MLLWISGEIDVKVYDEFRDARKPIEAIVNARIDTKTYDANFLKWAYLPIILSEAFIDYYKEVKRYNKKTQVCEFRLHIDFHAFKDGDVQRRRELLAQSLLRTLDIMETMKTVQCNVAELRKDFTEVALENGWIG